MKYTKNIFYVRERKNLIVDAQFNAANIKRRRVFIIYKFRVPDVKFYTTRTLESSKFALITHERTRKCFFSNLARIWGLTWVNGGRSSRCGGCSSISGVQRSLERYRFVFNDRFVWCRNFCFAVDFIRSKDWNGNRLVMHWNRWMVNGLWNGVWETVKENR